MAVFTPVTKLQIENFLHGYGVGELVTFEGIAQGIDNTNYKIETTTGKYILTIFEERINPEDLPFFLKFMKHISESGITCPSPRPLSSISGKPAALFSFLEGSNVEPDSITPELCHELGILLGKMHLAGQNFKGSRANSMSIEAWDSRLHKVGKLASPYFQEIAFIKSNWPTDLPSGTVHADLFPDNVFMRDGHIYGVIDFYFSATDFLAYDLAIVMNAWCFDADHEFNNERWNSLLSGYQSIRPLTPSEKESYQTLCRGAALRFLSSRLHDLIFHDPKALVTPKPPTEYIQKLDFHRHEKLF